MRLVEDEGGTRTVEAVFYAVGETRLRTPLKTDGSICGMDHRWLILTAIRYGHSLGGILLGYRMAG